MNLLIKISLLFFFCLLFSCSNNKSENEIEIKISPDKMYSDALFDFENTNYESAVKRFNEIESKFPLSKEAIQSQIMVAFIEYMRLEYDLAILKLNNII